MSQQNLAAPARRSQHERRRRSEDGLLKAAARSGADWRLFKFEAGRRPLDELVKYEHW